MPPQRERIGHRVAIGTSQVGFRAGLRCGALGKSLKAGSNPRRCRSERYNSETIGPAMISASSISVGLNSPRSMQAAAAEKRRHARIPVPPDTLVDSEYRAINLSESGIQVWSASHLDEGATLELVLQLDDMRVTGSGAVRWSRSAATVGDSWLPVRHRVHQQRRIVHPGGRALRLHATPREITGRPCSTASGKGWGSSSTGRGESQQISEADHQVGSGYFWTRPDSDMGAGHLATAGRLQTYQQATRACRWSIEPV